MQIIQNNTEPCQLFLLCLTNGKMCFFICWWIWGAKHGHIRRVANLSVKLTLSPTSCSSGQPTSATRS
jgi:hypothetical protein